MQTDFQEFAANHIHKYPDMVSRVHSYLETFCQSTLPKILFINHDLGGGVKTHLNELINLYREQAEFIVLNPIKDNTYVLSFDQLDECVPFHLPDQYQDLLYLLNLFNLSKIHFHHLINLHPSLRNLGEDLNVAMDFTIHDFYLVNGNPTLTDKRGFFCAAPETRDELCAEVCPLPCDGNPGDWRNEVRQFLFKCQHIIAPSVSTAEIVQSYFPEISFTVAYHPDTEFTEYPSPSNWEPEKKTLKVLTLGAISQVKGASLLEETAIIAHKKGTELEFHILGYPYRPLHASINTHGPYQSTDLARKLEEIKPDLVWLPSLWPETYSYTLSESLLAGIPVVVPDIGAFPERVSGRPSALVYPWNSSPEQMFDIFSKLRTEGPPESASQFNNQIADIVSHHFYENQYLTDLAPNTNPTTKYLSLEWLASSLDLEMTNRKQVSYSERFLLKIFHFRNTLAGRFLSRMIPIQFQRKIKIMLSHKPIHELTN